MKKWLLLGLCVFLLSKFLDSRPLSQVVYTEPGLGEVNQSQAALNYTEAAKIQQDIDRQNYMDDGIAANVGARTVLGQGVTPAEQIGTVISTVLFALCALPSLALLGLYLMWKAKKPSVVVVE